MGRDAQLTQAVPTRTLARWLAIPQMQWAAFPGRSDNAAIRQRYRFTVVAAPPFNAS
jgi:hypothetical protein